MMKPDEDYNIRQSFYDTISFYMKKVFYFPSPKDHKLVLDSLYSPALPYCEIYVIAL